MNWATPFQTRLKKFLYRPKGFGSFKFRHIYFMLEELFRRYRPYIQVLKYKQGGVNVYRRARRIVSLCASTSSFTSMWLSMETELHGSMLQLPNPAVIRVSSERLMVAKQGGYFIVARLYVSKFDIPPLIYLLNFAL